MLATLLALDAAATTGLSWTWPEGTTRRYLLQAQVRLPEVLFFNAVDNTEVRVQEFYVALDTTCASRGGIVTCRLDDVQLEGAAHRGDIGRLGPVVEEWDVALSNAKVQLEFADDGRIRSFDLEGVTSRNDRERRIAETMRIVLTRAFAALDLQMPKKGDDKGEAWKQSTALACHLAKPTGSLGSISLVSQITATEGSVVTIETTGRATVSSGEAVAGDTQDPSQERLRNVFDLELRGSTSFDVASGRILERQYLVDGQATASSALSTAGTATYVQAVKAKYLEPGDAIEAFGPSREVELSVGQ